MLSLKALSALLFSMSLLNFAICEPLAKIYRRGSPSTTACPDITTTVLLPAFSIGFQTLTELIPAPCPTSTVVVFDGPCTAQLPPPDCGEIDCVDLITSTVGCPGGCCPTQVPLTTTTVPCTRQCGAATPGGCPQTFITTSTVGC